MKTKQLFFTMVAILVTLTAFAAKNPQMNIQTTEAGKIMVAVESEKALPLEIEIVNTDGKLVYQWKSEKPTNVAKQLFDLSKMGNGEFRVTLNYGGNSVTRNLNVTKRKVEIGDAVYNYEPLFSYRDNILKVSYLNLENKNVFVKVYKEGEYFAGLNLGKTTDIQKAIDFSTVGNGEYNIVLSDNKNEHYFTIAK